MQLYGLDVLLHKEIQEIFNNNRMIAACLYADQPDDDYYRVRYELQQHEMSMEVRRFLKDISVIY